MVSLLWRLEKVEPCMGAEKRQYWESSLVGLDMLTILLDPELTHDERVVQAKRLIGDEDQKANMEFVLFSAARFLIASLALGRKSPILEVIEGLQMRLISFPLRTALVPAKTWDDLVPPLSAADAEEYVDWMASHAAHMQLTETALEGCWSDEEHDRTVHLILMGLDMASLLSDKNVRISSEEWEQRGILWTHDVSLNGLLCHLAVPLVDEFVNIYPPLDRMEVIEGLREGVLKRATEEMGSE